MCEFPSWTKTQRGEVFFLTDREVNELFKGREYDAVGHHAIKEVFGVTGEDFEGPKDPIPQVFLDEILRGKCRKMIKIARINKLEFGEGGWINYIEHINGPKQWRLDGKRHREDGPAVEYPDGCKEWYLHGKHHRKDGPAVEWPSGHMEWFLNGKPHRIDGPAIKFIDGEKHWYLNGKIHREDGPAIELTDGTKRWFLNGKFQREIKGKEIKNEFNQFQI